jgi:predicted nucleic acid-binding protein
VTKIYLDTNVILDALFQRKPFDKDARQIFELADMQQIQLFTSADSMTNMYYLISKQFDKNTAYIALLKVKALTSISSVDQTIIDQGLKIDPFDFEDAVQYFSAKEAECEVIISRDKKGFKQFDMLCQTPKEFLDSL